MDKSGQAAECWRLPRGIDSENGLIHNPSVNRTGRARIQLLCDADDNARNCSKSEDYKRSVKSVTIIAVIEADAAPRGATVRESSSANSFTPLEPRSADAVRPAGTVEYTKFHTRNGTPDERILTYP